MKLPDCMMPDGAEPCAAFQERERRIAELERRHLLAQAHREFIEDVTAVSCTTMAYATEDYCFDAADVLDGFRVLQQKLDKFREVMRKALEGE